jgi:hypothetical protein
MKKIGDIMAEMGFRKDAPDSVKEAFIKHLIKSATGVDVETPTEKREKLFRAPRPKAAIFQNETPRSAEPEQLSFAFIEDVQPKKAKVS